LIEDDYPPSGIGETYPLVPEYSDAMSMLVASQSRDELMDSYLISLEESFVQSVWSDFSMSGWFIPDFHNAYWISAISYGQNWLPSWVRSFRTRHNMWVDDPFSLDDVLTTQNWQYQGTHYPVGSTICNHQCGNGILEWWEECDDGWIEWWDGCDMLCKIEADVTCDDSLLQFDYNQDWTFNQYDIEYLRSYILHINIYTGTAENCDAEWWEYYEWLQYCCPEWFVCDLNCSGQVSTIDLAILAKLDAELVEIDELCFCE
jgi:cysteine-rich repeat protein